MDWISAIVKGAAAGAIFSQAQYWKKDVKFDTIKFGSTIVLGVVGGILVELTGGNLETHYMMMVSGGFAVIVENVLKIIKRRLLNK